MNKPRYIRIENAHVPLREFHFYDGNNTPSWERPGQSRSGRASIDVRTHVENPYLSFVVSESGDRSNRQVMADGRLRANHVGGRLEETEALYADDTRQADDRAILLKVRDHVRLAVDSVAFARRVEAMSGLTEVRVTGDPEKAIEVLAKKVGATEGERTGILRSLIEGGDLSAWGLLNAVTAQAHTATTYDRSVEFDRMGGQLLELKPTEWRQVLQAA